MMPTVNALVPRTVTMNMGSRLWTISEEMSINMLTKPKTQTPEGICRNVEFESLGATVTIFES